MPTRVHKIGVFYWCINNNKNFGLIYGGSKLFARPSNATEEAKGTKGSSPAPLKAVEKQKQPDDPPPSDEKKRAAAAADPITEMEEPESEAKETEKKAGPRIVKLLQWARAFHSSGVTGTANT